MGKRSDFAKRDKDFYPTIDPRAVTPLNHIKSTYYEPCVGDGHLVRLLDPIGMVCVGSSDIQTGVDALSLSSEDVAEANYIVTNPPWSRPLLHPLIEHLSTLKPTLLLMDADWMHTKQARPYLKYCHEIISVGRLKWIEGTNMSGKDNCAWYLFDKNIPHKGTTFYPREDE